MSVNQKQLIKVNDAVVMQEDIDKVVFYDTAEEEQPNIIFENIVSTIQNITNKLIFR